MSSLYVLLVCVSTYLVTVISLGMWKTGDPEGYASAWYDDHPAIVGGGMLIGASVVVGLGSAIVTLWNLI